MFRRTCVLAASFAVLLIVPVTSSADAPVVGAPGAGDPFFPQAGNGGYDVRHYSLDLSYAPTPVNRLKGRVAIFARATQSLSRFNVDLRDFLTVSRVTVNVRRATFTHSGQELSITPRSKIRRGSTFVVLVEYAGQPLPVVDPDEAIEGWVPTDDGAIVVNEPQGAPGWFPVNDTPLDKATYDFAITVPAGSAAIANGVLISRQTRRDTTTWRWLVTRPMASYLATATNGPFETRFRRLPGGLPEYNAVDPDTREDYDADDPENPKNPALAWERLEPQPEIVRFFSSLYGPYPFESIGSIIDWAPEVGYALESQTRINYDIIPDPATVVHEIAHQWFGNAVTLASWPDIWLNEGFATWSEWIYDERHGGPPAQERFDELYGFDEDSEEAEGLWSPAPAALPGPAELFHRPVYDRGGMTLQALRQKIGDDTIFLRILRTWYRDHRNGNVSTAQFIALAERESRRQLDDFFRVWLYEQGKPEAW